MGVMSPFEVPPPHEDSEPARHSPFRTVLIVLYSLILLLALTAGSIFLWKRTVGNPYRTLEVFSADKYFENPTALIGNRFQATLRVEGDLGWSSEVGKLMVFTVEGDSRYVPVLVQGDQLKYAFSKGQTYLAQIQVREGGLLYALEIRKN